jgi:predicted ATPase
MLTKLIIRHFKQFEAVDIDLSDAVVFIGPNNSGKTTALQALALWDTCLRHWLAKCGGVQVKTSKPVPMGRKDLTVLPLPTVAGLWRNQQLSTGLRDAPEKSIGLVVEILLEGRNETVNWRLGVQIEYVNEESFNCRPVFVDDAQAVAQLHQRVRPAFLPPIGSVLTEEPLFLPSRVDALLHAGRGGEVLRNLCYAVWEKNPASWQQVSHAMRALFGITLRAPELVEVQGLLELAYQTSDDGPALPITCAGLGMLQTLQLLVFLHWKPGAVLLLDEPDAHLEILRQRQTYQTLVDLARRQGSQIICASHSEVILNEAIQRDRVVAFVGQPHTVQASAQVLKSLRDYGFEHYAQAEQKGWVLYLEGSTDLSILQAWAKQLNHPAGDVLARPFVHYLNSNVPSLARNHFNAVREANPHLVGVSLFDRMGLPPQGSQPGLTEQAWRRREIENYFSEPAVLLAFARAGWGLPQHGDGQRQDEISQTAALVREQAMQAAIDEVAQALLVLGEDVWSTERKASEQVLPQILQRYAGKVPGAAIPNKGSYYILIDFQDAATIDPEVREVLDTIARVAAQALTLNSL